ncbi:MAG: flavin reductase family protein [Deltaproteobacteria bacterium]|nr:flavin reductase family protein [Deltaproteobacteria bacterium]
MPIDKSELRRVMGHFATGVTIITTRDEGGRPFGLTANAVSSVSLVPPLMLVCVDKNADTYPYFERSGVFTINILAEGQETLSRKFATSGIEKFAGIGHRTNELGCAVLDDAVGHLACRVVRAIDAGDHTIYLGEVDVADAGDGAPLLFFRGGYRKLGP